MKFGPVAAAEAEGALAAHTVRAGGTTIRKGTRLDGSHVAALLAAGVEEIVAARLEPDDVHEDEAAGRLATVIAGDNLRVERPFTGRCNLHADAAGVLVVDRAAIDRLNRIDPAITVATLPEFAAVEAGRMVATVKIIPFAAPAASLAEAEAEAKRAPALKVAPFRPLRIGVVATTLPALKPSVLDKTRRVLDERLAPTGAAVTTELRVPHEAEAVAEALRQLAGEADLLLVFGASAVVDARDVIPAGIVSAGGTIRHLGMPVDPGNLLVMGEIGGRPVLGAPGCARSPKENGFDWVLQRLVAGLDVTPQDVTGMGVGGLLMEIVSRPQPREGGPGQAPADEDDEIAKGRPKVAALVLAAGQARRMGGPNKLLAEIDGRKLARIAVEAALGSTAASVTVVTGHQSEAVAEALSGLDVAIVRNPDYAGGLSTSLRAGLDALPADIEAAIVLLADMPQVSSAMIDDIVAAYDPEAGALAVVPTFEGKRGNPVLWSRRFFDELRAIQGDTGARHLIGKHADAVIEIEVGAGAALDLDTPEALAAAGGRLPA